MSVVNRRNMLKLGALAAAAGMGYASQAYYFDVVPEFSHIEEYMDDLPQTPEGRIVWHDQYKMAFVEDLFKALNSLKEKTGSGMFDHITSHPFPVYKYRAAYRNALERGMIQPHDVIAPGPMIDDDFLLVHSSGYIKKLKFMETTRMGLLNGENVIPPGLVEYLRLACGGTYLAARSALENGAAMNLNGGFHHAFADMESGFCYINDVAIAIKKLRAQRLVKRAMLIDLDVHHGDGNASVMMNDEDVYIYDFYQDDNFPPEKHKVECKVALDGYAIPQVTDERYLGALSKTLPKAVEEARPDLVFYLAGSDPHENDVLGGFKLTIDGMKERDRFTVETVRKKDIPLAVVCAGGYPSRREDIVSILTNTIGAAMSAF